MNTKLVDLLVFPASMTYKIIGIPKINFINQVIEVAQYHVPGDYSPTVLYSCRRKYCSISITIIVKNIHEVESLYNDLSDINNVRMVF
ncbi:DUF493 family protein YbeD [Candidatus Erwinia haradaeae]|uniref:UPF0250 protein ERCICURV3402_347 n=1 Tax=Candidatus Erwinia haradaeae TaxID=1922217 RepID=A0A451D837_9GAMM|nr:DUF493 family protein YbeD [Candidatus Erwinia haradaeae]VFP82010.1 UPF0250 protein YbeD [Candidatus Erwinia haradaeae]